MVMNAVHTFYTCSQKGGRAKEDESKHDGAANELISEQERFDCTDIIFASIHCVKTIPCCFDKKLVKFDTINFSIFLCNKFLVKTTG